MKKVVIVSGGANGLGLELVEILHKNGYFVCNIDKDDKALQKIAVKFSNNYKSFCGNIADEKFVIVTIKEINQLVTLLLCLIMQALLFSNSRQNILCKMWIYVLRV